MGSGNPEPGIDLSQGLLDKMTALEIKSLSQAVASANALAGKLTAEEVDELNAAFSAAGFKMTLVPVLPEPPQGPAAVEVNTLFDVLRANAMALGALTCAVEALQDVAASLRPKEIDGVLHSVALKQEPPPPETAKERESSPEDEERGEIIAQLWDEIRCYENLPNYKEAAGREVMLLKMAIQFVAAAPRKATS